MMVAFRKHPSYCVRIATISTSREPSPAPRGGVALFRLVRYWSRRWSTQAATHVEAEHALDVTVLEAIDSIAATGSPSVTAVAEQLGVDRSGSSRMVSATVNRGFAVRRTDPDDTRRATLELTADGRELLVAAREWQESVFAAMTADWPPKDAARFAGYLERLAAQELPITPDEERQA